MSECVQLKVLIALRVVESAGLSFQLQNTWQTYETNK